MEGDGFWDLAVELDLDEDLGRKILKLSRDLVINRICSAVFWSILFDIKLQMFGYLALSQIVKLEISLSCSIR